MLVCKYFIEHTTTTIKNLQKKYKCTNPSDRLQVIHICVSKGVTTLVAVESAWADHVSTEHLIGALGRFHVCSILEIWQKADSSPTSCEAASSELKQNAQRLFRYYCKNKNFSVRPKAVTLRQVRWLPKTLEVLRRQFGICIWWVAYLRQEEKRMIISK